VGAESGKQFFRAIAKFVEQWPAASNGKIILMNLLNEKMDSFRPAR